MPPSKLFTFVNNNTIWRGTIASHSFIPCFFKSFFNLFISQKASQQILSMKSENKDLHPMSTPTITSKFHRSSSQQGSRPWVWKHGGKDLWFFEGFKPYGLDQIKGGSLSISGEFCIHIHKRTVERPCISVGFISKCLRKRTSGTQNNMWSQKCGEVPSQNCQFRTPKKMIIFIVLLCSVGPSCWRPQMISTEEETIIYDCSGLGDFVHCDLRFRN